MTRPAQVVINLNALRQNLSRIRTLAPRSRVIAVVKADAYGHGLATVAGALDGADAFGVSCLEEAEGLRAAGVDQPVLLLEGPFSEGEIPRLDELRLETVIHDPEQIRMLGSHRFSRPIRAWLKVDSGMHRLGFAPADAAVAWRRLNELSGLERNGLMTHLADATNTASDLTNRQLETFQRACAGLSGDRSIANSAGIIAWPGSHADYVRPGLMLYGISPMEEGTAADHGLHPVMSLQSRLIAVREVQKGEPVGYGAGWRCPENMPVGVVAAGYADGFPRHAPSGTPVMVKGRRSQLVGRPSMDMLTVDLRGIPDPKVGDPVELWGASLPVEEIARAAGTIPYELVCAVHKRLRVIVHEQPA